jgi:hypothetical protein
MAYEQVTTPTTFIQMAAPEPITEPAGPSDMRSHKNYENKPVTSASASPFAGTDLRSIKIACGFSLGEYIVLQKGLYQSSNPQDHDRFRAQAGTVVSDLRALRSKVSAVTKMAEAQRWRRWLFGGLL